MLNNIKKIWTIEGRDRMSITKDIIKLGIILIIAAILIYLIYPKYSFLGPKHFAFYRCNNVTGTIKAWDFDEQKWVTPNRKIILKHLGVARHAD